MVIVFCSVPHSLVAVRNCGADSKTVSIIYTKPKPIIKPAVEEKKDAKPTTPIPDRKGGG